MLIVVKPMKCKYDLLRNVITESLVLFISLIYLSVASNEKSDSKYTWEG